MLENSTAGLHMLDAAREVTVTREEDHQRVLARYPVTHSHSPRVAVELTWCVIAAGKYRGQRTIEIRLDGQRVGELTHAMTQRYGPSVAAIIAAGHRPGCEATISAGDRGLQLQLHLPPAGAPVRPAPPRPGPVGVPHPSTAYTPTPPYAPPLPYEPSPPLPYAPSLPVPAQRAKKSKKVPVAFAGAVVGMVAIISSIVAPSEDTPTSRSLPLTTTTAVTKQITTQRPTTTTTRPTTTTTKPKPKPTTTRPKPTTTRPAPPPPAPDPAPSQDCNPNYDPCVPNDPDDVDCASGSGNGPSYVEGPVRVIGTDVYDLDRDNDGEGCE